MSVAEQVRGRAHQWRLVRYEGDGAVDPGFERQLLVGEGRLEHHHQWLGQRLCGKAAECEEGRFAGRHIGARDGRRHDATEIGGRSEGRRLGKECVGTVKSRWAALPSKTKKNK